MRNAKAALLCLLGPVEIHHNGQRVEFGSGRLARLLVALVEEQARPVSRKSLMEWVWDDEEKRLDARLTELMAELRRRFKLAGLAATIVCEHKICRLDIAAESVDVHLFDQLVAAARDAVAAGADEEALAMLRQALELFRGEPLGALTGEQIENYRRRLEKAQANARIDYAEIMVRSNRHGEALPVLDELHRADPYQQKVAELRMLATYRAGEKVRATEIFTQVRRDLVQVGMDVGKSLAELHQRILEQDPTLDPTLSRIEQRSGHEVPGIDDTIKRNEKSYTTGDKSVIGNCSIAAEFVVLGPPGPVAAASVPAPDALRDADHVVTGKKFAAGERTVATEYAVDNWPPR